MPLAGLTALQSLDLTGTQVADVSALRLLNVTIRGGPKFERLRRLGPAIRRIFGLGDSGKT
jgi:hypothetical protein